MESGKYAIDNGYQDLVYEEEKEEESICTDCILEGAIMYID
ncbi:hypothetical protein [Streptobacillus moniliformis]|nr:hypothetical protein [Streptobacillus moniliformis]